MRKRVAKEIANIQKRFFKGLLFNNKINEQYTSFIKYHIWLLLELTSDGLQGSIPTSRTCRPRNAPEQSHIKANFIQPNHFRFLKNSNPLQGLTGSGAVLSPLQETGLEKIRHPVEGKLGHSQVHIRVKQGLPHLKGVSVHCPSHEAARRSPPAKPNPAVRT